MFTTILIGVLLLIAVVLFVVKIPVGHKVEFRSATSGHKVEPVGRYETRRVPVHAPRTIGFVPLVLALIVAVFSMTTMVQAKQVGVLTTFGKPAERTLSSGLHFKAPWQKVTAIDATIQTDEYHGDTGIQVRLSDGNTAKVSATVRWSVSEENANDVYADFRSDDPTESLRDAVVSTQFKAAMNSVFATFDPLTLADSENAVDYNALADEVTRVMLTRTNDLVNIESVTISLLSLDQKSQAKIDALIGEVAKTNIAKQAQATAEARAEANRILSESISNDPNVLVAQCFDLLAEGDFQPPAGFSCWPGGNGGVVIPGSKR